MSIIDLVHQSGGPDSEPFVVSLVDDPVGGSTLLVVMFESGGHTAVFDFDALIEREDIEPLGPAHSSRIETEFRAELGLE
jgi:hypothetical protein